MVLMVKHIIFLNACYFYCAVVGDKELIAVRYIIDNK